MIIEKYISKKSEKEIRKIDRKADLYHLPMGAQPVDAFSQGSVLREACAMYWSPSRIDAKFSASSLYNILDSTPRGLYYRILDGYKDSAPCRVRILLTYPLTEAWECISEVPIDRFGDIFGDAHDLYKFIYDMDDNDWKEQGEEGEAPRLAPGSLNRARGKHVWGHDMSDLVFEGLRFLPEEGVKPVSSANPSQLIGTVTFSIGS